MRTYVIRRLLMIIPTVFMVSLIIFLLTHLIPGDIIDAMQAATTDVKLPRAELERALGLDVSLMHQYGRWLGVVPQADGNLSGLFQGSLGSSLWRRCPSSNNWPKNGQ